MVARRKVVDRERLELDYRAGLHTFRQMAETHGISGPRIKQIADEEGWERDLGAKMRQAAAAQLVVATAPPSPEKARTEREIVDQGAQNIVELVLGHRRDAARARALAMVMMRELEAATTGVSMLRELQQLVAQARSAGEEVPRDLLVRADELLGRLMTLDSRASTLKTLTESLSKVIAIERDAFGVADPDIPQPPGDGDAAANFAAFRAAFKAAAAKHGVIV